MVKKNRCFNREYTNRKVREGKAMELNGLNADVTYMNL